MTATAAQTSLGEAPQLRHETSHLAGLDGLRAIAVGLVLLQHIVPLHRIVPHPPGTRVSAVVPPLGYYGVSLFFVLSGFLITRILLAGREKAEAGLVSTPRLLGTFYARRTLRIFPLYYGTLLVLALLDVGLIRERFAWHATYMSNWLFSNASVWEQGGAERHFWSLAVEEQFYLFWPWLMLLVPRRLLLPGLILTCLLAPAWRAWFALSVGPQGQTWPSMWTQFPTPANLDLLAGGGILACLWPMRARRWMIWGCLLVGLPTSAVAVGLFRTEILLETRRIFQVSALGLLFIAWIGLVAGDEPGTRLMTRVLSWRPLAYLGKISYGIYVLHTFAAPSLRGMGLRAWERDHPWLFAWSAVALAVAAASLSWHVFEAPINRLKRRVPYVAGTA